MKQHKFYCEVYPHPDSDGDIIILPGEHEEDFNPLNLAWGGYQLSNNRMISVGRDMSAKIVAIHIPAGIA